MRPLLLRVRRMARMALVFLAVFPLQPRPVAAWMLETHRKIAADALEVLPAPMREFLRPSLDDLQKGAVAPDFNPATSRHHSYCIETDCGDAPDWIVTEYAGILSDFKPRPPWVRAVAGIVLLFPAGCSSQPQPLEPFEEEETNLAFRLGVIAHYMADVNVPYHTLPFEEPAKSRHVEFEMAVENNLSRLIFSFDGRLDDVGADLKNFAIGKAQEARADLAIVDDPSISHRSARYQAAVDRSYSRAVNAVADLWYSLWYDLYPKGKDGNEGIKNSLVGRRDPGRPGWKRGRSGVLP